MEDEQKPLPLVESSKKLDEIATQMNKEKMLVMIAEPDKARYSFESDVSKEFEIVWRHEFWVH